MRHNHAPHVRRRCGGRHVGRPLRQQVHVHDARPIAHIQMVNIAEMSPKPGDFGVCHNIGERFAANVIVARDVHHRSCITVVRSGPHSTAVDTLEPMDVALELLVAGDAALVHQVAEENNGIRPTVRDRMRIRGAQEAIAVADGEYVVAVGVECFAEDLRIGNEQQARAIPSRLTVDG